jgi:hypothetical protein
MGQFFLQLSATLIAALLVFGAGVLVFRWQKKRDSALAMLDEFQRFDVERISAIVEKHLPRVNRARRRYLQEAPAYACTYTEFNAGLNEDERRTLVPFIQFFERLVLLHESNSVDRRALWSVLGRQVTWWQQQFFWMVEPDDANNAYGIASQVDRIAALQESQEDPWYSLFPKVRLIPAKPTDRAIP